MSNTFIDPSEYPVIFSGIKAQPILFGHKQFPVSFVLGSSPRQADFSSFCIRHKGVFICDEDPYTTPVQLANGASHKFELVAGSKDITDPYLRLWIYDSEGTATKMLGNSLESVKQGSYETSVSQLFSMDSSTWNFSGYSYGGSMYYPTASLYLSFQSNLENNSHPFHPLSLKDMQDTQVLLSPADAWGVLDILASVEIKWYTDEARTVVSATVPYEADRPVYGIRFYLTQAGRFALECSTSGSTATISSVYPTSVLKGLAYPAIDSIYWVNGSRPRDLYFDEENSIEVSDSGLPIQLGREVAFYSLVNSLEDIDFSSSSCSSYSSNSSSSLNSSSSISSQSESSTLDMSTSFSESSSSSSSSSPSSSSSETDSSESSSSLSSRSTYSSESTSSHSFSQNLSSESSGTPEIVAEYSFLSEPDGLGIVTDTSGNDNHLRVPSQSGGIGPPTWTPDGGVSGGAFEFYSDPGTPRTDYLIGHGFNGISDNSSGSLGMWLKPSIQDNPVAIPLSICNFSSDPDTEIYIGLDSSTDQIVCSCSVDGVPQWRFTSESGLVSTVTDKWTYLTLTHDRIRPRLYINRVKIPISFSVTTSKSAWILALMRGDKPADRILLGGISRNFSPYVALGYTGTIDEVTIWNKAIDREDMLPFHSPYESSSS